MTTRVRFTHALRHALLAALHFLLLRQHHRPAPLSVSDLSFYHAQLPDRLGMDMFVDKWASQLPSINLSSVNNPEPCTAKHT